MVRYYEASNRYKYNWEQVVRAFWCRYPNPYSKHVLSEDVVDRFVDVNGNLCTKRLLSKTNRAPKWAEKFISSRVVFIIEESILDPINKIFITYTRNIGMQSLMTIEEKCTYTKSIDNNCWTCEKRQAWINSSMYGLSRAIQAFGVERFKQNISKTYKGFQMVLDAMNSSKETNTETILSLHPFLFKKTLRERAMMLTEAAKSKAVPRVSAATQSSQQQ